MSKMRESKANLLRTRLTVSFGANTGTVRRAIRNKESIAFLGGDYEQIKRSAANLIASYCSSYSAALAFVEEWAQITEQESKYHGERFAQAEALHE